MSELWLFSRLIAASSILTLCINQIDKLVLARAFSLTAFGVYAVAANLAAAPQSLVLSYASRIMYPNLARVWREAPDHFHQTFYRGRGTIFYGYALASGGLIGAAPMVIAILYDHRYEGASSFLQILGVTTALFLLTRFTNEALVAAGHVKATLMMNVCRCTWLVAAGATSFLVAGPMGLIVALGMVEVPAYFYGAYYMRRLGLYGARWDLLAACVIVAGVVAGWGASLSFFAILGDRAL